MTRRERYDPAHMPQDFTLDFDRLRRVGFPEVVLAEGKTVAQTVEICRQLARAHDVLVTRLSAERWQEIFCFYTSPGFSDERVWLYLAEGLSDCGPGVEAEEDERIEIVPWPLERLEEAIAACEDSKSLIALLWLAARSASGSA